MPKAASLPADCHQWVKDLVVLYISDPAAHDSEKSIVSESL